MRSRAGRLRLISALGVIAFVGAVWFILVPAGVGAQNESKLKDLAQGRTRTAVLTTPSGVMRTMPAPSGGVVNAALAALSNFSSDDLRADEADDTSGPDAAAIGVEPNTLGCQARNPDKRNVRVNQDCSFRRQAEESIIYNPANPSNLLAGQNDSRVGYNQCGIDWSLNGGRKWGDLLPPFRQKLNQPLLDEPTTADPNRNTIVGGPGTLHTYDAASDPMVAMDSRGNGYFGCVIFDVASDASGLFVTLSPAKAEGSFFFNIPSFGRRYVVVEDNSPTVLHDKPFLVADKFASSPNRDNVYVTWTVFRYSATTGRYQQSPIYGSMSTDQGHTWSTPEQISGTSSTLCFLGNVFDPTLPADSCNFDQGSDPTVLPNGNLEVIFNNGNTAPTNPNGQQLGVHCVPSGSSTNGTAHLNCAAPAKVGDDVLFGPGGAAEPQCDFGRGPEECIPGAYIRTNDFPRDNKNVNGNTLYAAWQDYRNGEFDIQLAVSTNGGQSWNEAGIVNPDSGRDHYFAAIDVAPAGGGGRDDRNAGGGDNGVNGAHVGLSYYRTDRVPNENATPPVVFGCPPGTTTTAPFTCSGTGANSSDYVLAGVSGTHTPGKFKVISPSFAPPDGIQSGFNGDYSGLTITPDGQAHPIWSDTRNSNPFPENGVVHDEDIFTTSTGLP